MKLIVARDSRKQDTKIAICGEGGIGKSTCALRLGELTNPGLYVDNIELAIKLGTSFTGSEYMQGVRTMESGSQLTFDEPGQAWYHRQFMSEASMILSKTLIGFRYKRFKSVLNVPNIDLLDADAVRLLNLMIYVYKQGRAEVYGVMNQKFGGHPWFKKIIDDFRFSKPDTKLWHLYEEKKFKVQDELYEKYGKKLDDMDHPQLTNSEILSQGPN